MNLANSTRNEIQVWVGHVAQRCGTRKVQVAGVEATRGGQRVPFATALCNSSFCCKLNSTYCLPTFLPTYLHTHTQQPKAARAPGSYGTDCDRLRYRRCLECSKRGLLVARGLLCEGFGGSGFWIPDPFSMGRRGMPLNDKATDTSRHALNSQHQQ